MEKKEFDGSIKEAILSMFENESDCCEVTHMIDDTAVTVELTITKIVSKGEVLYDAREEDDDDDGDDEPAGISSIWDKEDEIIYS